MKPAPSVRAELRKPAETENSAGQEGSAIHSDESSPSSARECSVEASSRRDTSSRAVESLQHQLDQLDVCTPMAQHGAEWSPWPSAARRLSWASLGAQLSLLTGCPLVECCAPDTCWCCSSLSQLCLPFAALHCLPLSHTSTPHSAG